MPRLVVKIGGGRGAPVVVGVAVAVEAGGVDTAALNGGERVGAIWGPLVPGRPCCTAGFPGTPLEALVAAKLLNG